MVIRERHLVPLAVRVERHTVDWAEVTFDPAKLLFVGSMEEPEQSGGGVSTGARPRGPGSIKR